jgi:hypothetical protein
MREHERAIKTPTQGFLIFSLSLSLSSVRDVIKDLLLLEQQICAERDIEEF